MRLILLAALAAIACAGAGASRSHEQPAPPVPVVAIAPTAPPASQQTPELEVADAAPAIEQEPSHRIELVLHPSAKPCTVLVRSGMFEETPDHWLLGAVRYLATEQSAGCSAGVLFDPSLEVVAEGEEPQDALEGGLIAKPGAKLSDDLPEGGVLADYNFDGQLDLCVKQLFGAYNFSQRCWLFDPAKRGFVRNTELETMQNIEIDVRKRTLASSWRVGGPVYTAVEKRWIDGALVTTRETLTHLGETPSGKPLPPGKSSWEVEYVRRGGKLVKLREGPR